jgi:hypothetical protein
MHQEAARCNFRASGVKIMNLHCKQEAQYLYPKRVEMAWDCVCNALYKKSLESGLLRDCNSSEDLRVRFRAWAS